MKAFAMLAIAVFIVIGASVALIEVSLEGSATGIPAGLAHEITARYSYLGISLVIAGRYDTAAASWYLYDVRAPGYLASDYGPVYGFAKRVHGGWFDTGVGSAMVGCPTKDKIEVPL